MKDYRPKISRQYLGQLKTVQTNQAMCNHSSSKVDKEKLILTIISHQKKLKYQMKTLPFLKGKRIVSLSKKFLNSLILINLQKKNKDFRT